MNFKLSLVTSILLINAQLAFFFFKPETQLASILVDENSVMSNKMIFEAYELDKNSDSFDYANKRVEFTMKVDWSYDKIIVGNKTVFEWGNECHPDYCEIVNEGTCYYKGLSFECTETKLKFMPSTPDLKANPNYSQVTPTRVYFTQDKTLFSTFGNINLLGLGAGNDLMLNSDGEIGASQLTFVGTVKESGDYGLNVIVNHRFSYTIYENNVENKEWNFSQGNLVLSKEKKVTADVFLNFAKKTYYNFERAEEFCEGELRKICPGVGPCSPNTVDFSKGQTLSLESKGNAELRLTPDQYFVYENLAYRCKLSSPAEGHKIEFGFLMITKFPFSIVSQFGKTKIQLQNQFEEYVPFSKKNWVLVSVLTVGILICMALTCRVRKQHNKIKIE